MAPLCRAAPEKALPDRLGVRRIHATFARKRGCVLSREGAPKPIVDQAPPDVDLFDLAIAPGEHPRLFLDMIAFVDMGHDRYTYRFYQDIRHGRVLIAENQSADAIAAAVADYVARRLVERERGAGGRLARG